MKLILALFFCCAAVAQQQPCYAPNAIPNEPYGVDNPRDLANGTFVAGKAPGEKLDLYGLSGRDFRDMLVWIQEAIPGTPFCIEFHTQRSFDPGVGGQGDRPAVTMMLIRHRTQRAHIMESQLSATALWAAPHVSRIEIAARFAFDSRVSGRYYPGFHLRHPAMPSPVGEEWLNHDQTKLNAPVYHPSATFQVSAYRSGALHWQLDAAGNIVAYKLKRRRVGGGWFGFGGKDEWFWQYEGYSDQSWQPGDEGRIPSPVKQPPLRGELRQDAWGNNYRDGLLEWRVDDAKDSR